MSLDPDARYLGEVHDCPVCHMQPGSDTAREAGCTCPIYSHETTEDYLGRCEDIARQCCVRRAR